MTEAFKAHELVTITIPQEIRDAHAQMIATRTVALGSQAEYRAVHSSLGLDKYQARELSHRESEVAQSHGYDHESEYKYYKRYAMAEDSWGRRKNPHITMEWVEARHRMDVANRTADIARAEYNEYFATPGHPWGECYDLSQAYKRVVDAILSAEVA
jgi:hypothetical protein